MAVELAPLSRRLEGGRVVTGEKHGPLTVAAATGVEVEFGPNALGQRLVRLGTSHQRAKRPDARLCPLVGDLADRVIVPTRRSLEPAERATQRRQQAAPLTVPG